jgi:preprotein translocase subunit SecG
LSKRTRRGGPAPRERRRPGAPRSGLLAGLERVTPWLAVGVLVLSMVVLAVPTYLQAKAVLTGEQTGYPALLDLGALLAGEVVIALMVLLTVDTAAPGRVRLSPALLARLGAVVFVGLFFLILLVLRGEVFAAAPIIVYFIGTRRRLADQLPVWAGGRKMPERKEGRRDDVIRRPPRSWDEPGSGRASASGQKRRKKKSRRSGPSGRGRPRGR